MAAKIREWRQRVWPGEKISGPVSFLVARGKTSAGVNVSAESALTSAAAGSAVRLLASTVAQLPCILYRRVGNSGTGNGLSTSRSQSPNSSRSQSPNLGRERAVDEPLYRLLHDEPNGEISAFEFKEMMTAMMLLRGTAYAYIEQDEFAGARALWPIMPGRCWPERAASGELVYRVTTGDGAQALLLPREVFRLKGFAEHGLVGKAIIEDGREVIGTEMAMRDYRARWYGNGGAPNGKFKSEHPIRGDDNTEEAARLAKKKIAEDFRKAFTGDNQHHVLICDGGTDYTELGASPKDSQMRDGMTFQLQDVARLFGFSSTLLGDPNGMQYNGLEQLLIMFKNFGLGPVMGRWESALNMQLLPEARKGELFYEFLLDALMRGDFEARMRGYQIGIQNSVFMPNEVRRLENLDAVAGGDVLLTQRNMMAIGPDAEGYNAIVKDLAAAGKTPGATGAGQAGAGEDGGMNGRKLEQGQTEGTEKFRSNGNGRGVHV